MNKQINSKSSLILIIFLAIFVAGLSTLLNESSYIPSYIQNIFQKIPFFVTSPDIFVSENIEKFSSEEDFKTYLQESSELSSYGWGGGAGMALGRGLIMEEMDFVGAPMDGGGEPSRVSETNVQVKGIDEPDIVKTDGKEIYFASSDYYWRWGWGAEMMIVPPQTKGGTKIIEAFPPGKLGLDGEIDEIGNLLLHEDILMVFSGDKIYSYDISDPESPKKEWTMNIESGSYVTGARLYNNKVYLITRTYINTYKPCPITPLTVEGKSLEIKCADIYHPVTPVPVDATYNAVVFDPSTGEIGESVSFVGSYSQSVVYMSENGIYMTYSYTGDFISFYLDFLTEECKGLIPSWMIDKLNKLAGYDISDTSKMTELGVIFNDYYNSLDNDERLKMQNELTNKMSGYYKEHKRELEKTGIIKVDLDGFDVVATGNVPGQPLNQFSLDEYENHFRIAVTIGERFWWGIGPISGTSESSNDVYVLDKDLNITGSVENLGLEERIYSARFIQDKGYLVTFRQVDPFYVIDLSNPNNPELKGELKIPGYSSYLHPITKDKILGIGKEESQVKISLFNVEDPEEPIEADKYILDEYWSDILNTHHAFLLDSKHQIFFLPGSKGGYIFSYEGDKLSLTRAVSDIIAKRAIYINDYLYIIGEDKIIILNELDWEEVNRLDI